MNGMIVLYMENNADTKTPAPLPGKAGDRVGAIADKARQPSECWAGHGWGTGSRLRIGGPQFSDLCQALGRERKHRRRHGSARGKRRLS